MNETGGPVNQSQLDGPTPNTEEGDRRDCPMGNSQDNMARINNEQQDYSSRNDIAVDDLDDAHHRGDITSKRKNTLRIGFLNINGIPTKNDHPKNISLYEAIKSHEMDVIGLAETNKCWHTLDTRDSWKSRTTGWWQASKATFAYITTDCHSKKFQPGGTLQITNGRTTNRIETVA